MTINVELYGAETGNSFRAAIALSEAGLAFKPIRLDLRAGDHRHPEFLTLNSAGKVPTLVDHGSSPVLIINQSNAIIQYADLKSPGTLAPLVEDRRLKTLDRFFYFVTDVISSSHAAFFLRRAGMSEGSPALAWHALDQLRLAEHFLEEDYIAGQAFSMADIAAYTFCYSVQDQLDWKNLPRMAAWFDRVGSRPAVQAGMLAFTPGAAQPWLRRVDLGPGRE